MVGGAVDPVASRKWYERVTFAQHPLNTRPADWRYGAMNLRSGSRTPMDATDA
ncbi:hypothetical protein GCM10010510_51200 [Streptomyces anandii JCM 4720]|nr:hypothetical protein GCM10010510_51200 [Streptomyces anandii JCM 4720]